MSGGDVGGAICVGAGAGATVDQYDSYNTLLASSSNNNYMHNTSVPY